MTIDYNGIFEQIGNCIEYVLPISIGWGLCERLVSFVMDAVMDRFRKTERI